MQGRAHSKWIRSTEGDVGMKGRSRYDGEQGEDLTVHRPCCEKSCRGGRGGQGKVDLAELWTGQVCSQTQRSSRGFPVKFNGTVQGQVSDAPCSNPLPRSLLSTACPALGWLNSGWSSPNSRTRSAKSGGLSCCLWGCWLGKGPFSIPPHQALSIPALPHRVLVKRLAAWPEARVVAQSRRVMGIGLLP